MSLLKSLATVSGLTLISRILGYVRDFVIARTFGVQDATDAFFIAFKLPNLLRRLFAEGAFSQAFVPILAEYKNRRGEQATRLLVDHVAGALALVLFVVTVIGVLAAPLIVYATASGFTATPGKFELTVDLLRVTFPYILFISLTAFAGGVLNTYSRFSVPAVTPSLLNLSFIGFALWGAPYFDPPVTALAWAVFVGGIAQLALQAPFLHRLGLFPRFKLDLKDDGVRRILRQMGPAVFGVSISQVSLVINAIYASWLVTGSVSWLYYADRLMEFPIGLLGVALGTILLPSLAKHHADRSTDEYSGLLDWGLRLTLLLGAPAAVALALLAVPLVTTLFHYGAFSADDVFATRRAVVAYSAGLIGLVMVKVLAPGFYARQDIRTPVRIALVTLGLTQVMNFAFIWPLQHAGLALAIGLGACINAALLLRILLQRNIYRPQAAWTMFLFKLAIAVYAMAVVLWLASGPEASWLVMGAAARVGHLAWIVLAGAATYFAALWLLGFRLGDFSKRAAE
jgi:putative peptidoglycan lipid II flippase